MKSEVFKELTGYANSSSLKHSHAVDLSMRFDSDFTYMYKCEMCTR